MPKYNITITIEGVEALDGDAAVDAVMDLYPALDAHGWTMLVEDAELVEKENDEDEDTPDAIIDGMAENLRDYDDVIDDVMGLDE